MPDMAMVKCVKSVPKGGTEKESLEKTVRCIGFVACIPFRYSSPYGKEAIDNNAAVLGTWGSSDYWYDAVRNFEGRPLKEALTAAWYKARVDEAVQTMHQREASFGRAVLVAESGMAQVIGVISGVNATAVNAGHFVPGQVIVTGQPITAADISAQRLRVVVEAQVGTAVRTFTFDSYLSQTAVN